MIPKVSIIIPAFNRAHLLGETLDSILAQTYEFWECIIVDDGSSDNTEAVVQDYIARDKRIKYYLRPNDRLQGGNAARNYGFELAKGEYVNWLDNDDIFSVRKLELQLKQILLDEADIAICQWAYIENENKKIVLKNNIISRNILNGQDVLYYYGVERTYLPSHNFLIKREVIMRAGLWNEWLSINQDGEFFTRVLIYSKKVSVIADNSCYVLYRKPIKENNSRISTQLKAEQFIKSWEMIHNYLLVIDKKRFSALIEYSKISIIKRLSSQYDYLLKRDKYYYSYKYRELKKKIKRKLKSLL